MLETYITRQEASFSLLAGGFHRCDPSWNKLADGVDQCYKLYLPVRGQARVTLDTQEVLLQPGQAYLIPGYHLASQECPRRMDVYWVHFVPDSLQLAFLMSHMAKVYCWRRSAREYWRATWRELPTLFEKDAGLLFLRVQAMLADLTAQALEDCGLDQVAGLDPILEQLKPAITFMDRHFAENPSLAEIAKTVHLAPNYFHRKFTGAFHRTPFDYLLQRRLNLGRRLLLKADLTLDRIAECCGFSSAFHFSRLFKRHCGMSPKQFRAGMGP